MENRPADLQRSQADTTQTFTATPLACWLIKAIKARTRRSVFHPVHLLLIPPVTSARYPGYLAALPDPINHAHMGLWGKKSEAVVICYRCRKRISPEELADGGHNHDGEHPEPLKPAADSGR